MILPETASPRSPVTQRLVKDYGPHVAAAVALEIEWSRYIPQTEGAQLLATDLALTDGSLDRMDGAAHRASSSRADPLYNTPSEAGQGGEEGNRVVGGGWWVREKARSGPGVEPIVDLPEMCPTHVRIDLSGGDIGVPEHELHRPEIRPMFEEVRREGVAQGVGGEPLADPRLGCVRPHALPEGLPRQAPAAAPQKEVGGRVPPRHGAA